jgi:2-keto-3-deoxy-L-rhamnonate aldolase RhmA
VTPEARARLGALRRSRLADVHAWTELGLAGWRASRAFGCVPVSPDAVQLAIAAGRALDVLAIDEALADADQVDVYDAIATVAPRTVEAIRRVVLGKDGQP